VIWHFFTSNWVALLSLIIALLGGVPGIIKVIELSRRAPSFGATVVNYIIGEAVTGEKSKVMLFLTLSVWNRGERPLIPVSFDLDVRKGSPWIRLDRTLIQSGVKFYSDKQDIQTEAGPQSDLQRTTSRISLDEPAYGHLMFLTDQLIKKELAESVRRQVRLSCTDVFDRVHKFKFSLEGSRPETALEYPRYKVIIKNKAGQSETK
jgi:hypothetical protein